MYKPFESFRLSGKLISVIGSGGKTTFLRTAADSLPGTVILTTSTHIYPFTDLPLVDTGSDVSPENRDRVLREIHSILADNRILCLGQLLSSGKLGSPEPVIPFEALLPLADHILVEADGAAGHPLKAHRPFEPVIPACSDQTVCLVGLSGIGQPAALSCHCPDLFCALSGLSPDQPVEAEHVAAVLNTENLADCFLISQADTLPDASAARRLCDLITKDSYVLPPAPARFRQCSAPYRKS